MKVLVTGSKGFIGNNLIILLKQIANVDVVEYDLDSQESLLNDSLATVDVVFHLAGVNRPQKPEDYETGNAGFTQKLCDQLRSLGRKSTIIFSSSIQAALDNPYGISKRRAEDVLLRYLQQTGARVFIFRLKNVFGKWCRPNYNSGVATFCHNIARNLPISVVDHCSEVNLVYVDDVCVAMMEAAGLLSFPPQHFMPSYDPAFADIVPSFKVTLGEIVDTIYSFKAARSSLQVPAFDDPFIYRLYATYSSYLQETDFAYDLDIKTDNRGSLAEFLKSPSFGQVFVSHTKPGIIRGNHYHNTKTEKFLVIQGQAIIRFRHIKTVAGGLRVESAYRRESIIEYRVSGDEYRVVDIPPGYAHSITNVGDEELVTLFWSNQIFDPAQPDTYYCEV